MFFSVSCGVLPTGFKLKVTLPAHNQLLCIAYRRQLERIRDTILVGLLQPFYKNKLITGIN
jgi:hypothetical protein